MFVLIFAAVVLVVGALVAGWQLLIWPIVKRPILSVPIALYIGLAAWLGAHDAQALFIYALIALVLWRLLHKDSFQRHVGRRLRRDAPTAGPGSLQQDGDPPTEFALLEGRPHAPSAGSTSARLGIS
jgi:hypothetical protein